MFAFLLWKYWSRINNCHREWMRALARARKYFCAGRCPHTNTFSLLLRKFSPFTYGQQNGQSSSRTTLFADASTQPSPLCQSICFSTSFPTRSSRMVWGEEMRNSSESVSLTECPRGRQTHTHIQKWRVEKGAIRNRKRLSLLRTRNKWVDAGRAHTIR